MDAESDRTSTDIFMAPIDGGDPLPLTTTTDESESSPRWSPDGRYLAFLSGRDDDNTQVWLLDRRGGEAKKLTAYDTGVSSIAWSPDGQRLAMVMRDIEDDSGNDARDEDDDADGGGRDPIVVTRLQFKRDGSGYLNDLRRHIYVFDLERQQTDQITSGPLDDGAPVWSPDGESIAFTSNRTAEPDATANTDIFIVQARSGQTARQLTTSTGSDGSPSFSPDGSFVTYVAGGAPADIWYATNNVAVVSAAGEPSRLLTDGLDRNLSNPRVTNDGAFITFRLEDHGNVHLARVPVRGGDVERVITGERDIRGFHMGDSGQVVVLETQSHYPPEVSLVDDAALLVSGRSLRNNSRAAPISLAGRRPRRRPPRHPRPVAARSPSRHTILSQGVEGTGPVAPPLDHGQTAELLGGAPHRDAIRPTQHAAVREQPGGGLASTDPAT